MKPSIAAERVIRDVALACRESGDVRALQAALLRSLRRVMPIDAAFLATADPTTLLFTSVLTEDPLDTVSAHFLDNELAGRDVNHFGALVRSRSHVASLDATTGSDRMASPRYRELMRPIGLGDELRAALVVGSLCWGYLCLHREDARLGFTAAERLLITRLGPHLADALRRVCCRPLPVSGPVPRAGVVLLDDDLSLVASTPEADELLSIVADEQGTRWSLPAAVFTAAAALQEQERRPESSTMLPNARVLGTNGRWLEIHASRLLGSPRDRRIVVVIEPAQHQSIAELLLASYGLSAREREVATLVLRGESTKTITATLRISAHTVQDHLKAIFDKTGVRSRRDLIGLLLAGGGPRQPAS